MSLPFAAAAAPSDQISWAAASPQPPDLDLRQLRHLSKNALQRLLCEVAKAVEQQADWRERRLLADLERRLMLSARVSDALFGFTRRPGPLAQRLTDLAEATVELMADRDQSIVVAVETTGPVDPAMENALLRVAHEMVGNAVRHGLHDRMIGRIDISVGADARSTRLEVRDDGWGIMDAAEAGGGIGLMQELAKPLGGEVSLTREGDRTCAGLTIPRARAGGLRWLALMTGWLMIAALPVGAIGVSWCWGVL
jgi:two-component sensor histidine kinase